MNESVPETYTANVPVQQVRHIAQLLREGGDIARADRLDEAAQIICEVLPSSDFEPGDRVRVREVAIALDPSLESYLGTIMVVDHAQDEGDVSVEHPTDGPCGFAAWELEKVEETA